MAGIPQEIVRQVAPFLDPQDIWRLRILSRGMNAFLSEEQVVKDALRKHESMYTSDPAQTGPAQSSLERRIKLLKAHHTGRPTAVIAATQDDVSSIIDLNQALLPPRLGGGHLAYLVDESTLRLVHLATGQVSMIRTHPVLDFALTEQCCAIFTLHGLSVYLFEEPDSPLEVLKFTQPAAYSRMLVMQRKIVIFTLMQGANTFVYDLDKQSLLRRSSVWLSFLPTERALAAIRLNKQTGALDLLRTPFDVFKSYDLQVLDFDPETMSFSVIQKIERLTLYNWWRSPLSTGCPGEWQVGNGPAGKGFCSVVLQYCGGRYHKVVQPVHSLDNVLWKGLIFGAIGVNFPGWLSITVHASNKCRGRLLRRGEDEGERRLLINDSFLVLFRHDEKISYDIYTFDPDIAGSSLPNAVEAKKGDDYVWLD